jgi:16S rRNA (cytidine1402-2'-O)-methyltransferase
VLGDRKISVSRELTKKFEETIRGQLSKTIEHFKRVPIRGEFVIVVAPRE